MPKRRHVFEGLRPDCLQHRSRDSDLGDGDRAAIKSARQKEMAGLLAKEGDGLGGPAPPLPITAPDVPLMPLGRSTATIGAGCAFMASIIARASPSTGRSSPAPNSASITTVRTLKSAGLRPSAPGPSMLRGKGGVALQPARLPDQQRPRTLITARRRGAEPRQSRPRRYCPVRPRQRPAADGMAGNDGLRDRRAGPLHEVDAGTPPAIAKRSASAISVLLRSSSMAPRR